MTEAFPDTVGGAPVLGVALKSIRRLRRLTAAETATLMNISPSAYERFENGDTKLNLEYVHRFARATKTDYYAIVVALIIGKADFALYSAGNQFASILTNGLHDLARDAGADLAALSTRDILEIVTPMFETLAAKAREMRALQDEVDAAAARLDASRPPPGR